jgi:hypothetical protein
MRTSSTSSPPTDFKENTALEPWAAFAGKDAQPDAALLSSDAIYRLTTVRIRLGGLFGICG